VKSLIKAAKQDGVTLQVAAGGGARTFDEQQQLFRRGRSTPGSLRTWTLTSYHLPGRAVDLEGPDAAAYDWIQKNAPRFGFGVIGADDPGHIQMPKP
jgi:LAS superfamily LD-carboxypeptidase LdcB